MEPIIEKIAQHGPLSVYTVRQDGEVAYGTITECDPPGGKNFLCLRCKKGFMACRLLNGEMANQIGSNAALFAGSSFELMMGNKPAFLSDGVRALGATEEMTGREIFRLLND